MAHLNRLLAALSEADGALLEPDLEHIDLPLGLVRVEPAGPIPHAVFIETGQYSVVSNLGDGSRIEVGLFDRDGMAIPTLMLMVDTVPYQIFMPVAGRGHRIAVPARRAAIAASPSLRDLLLRYGQTFMVQVAQTAIAHADRGAARALAPDVLRPAGRRRPLGHPRVPLDHAGRTTAHRHGGDPNAGGRGLIRARRGHTRVIDRGRLEEAAGQTYGPAEAEYERLIGPMRTGRDAMA